MPSPAQGCRPQVEKSWGWAGHSLGCDSGSRPHRAQSMETRGPTPHQDLG